MILQDEVKIMALTDLIANLKKCKQIAKVAGFDWSVDDSLSDIIDAAEFELDGLT